MKLNMLNNTYRIKIGGCSIKEWVIGFLILVMFGAFLTIAVYYGNIKRYDKEITTTEAI